jgi:hypothetical protein
MKVARPIMCVFISAQILLAVAASRAGRIRSSMQCAIHLQMSRVVLSLAVLATDGGWGGCWLLRRLVEMSWLWATFQRCCFGRRQHGRWRGDMIVSACFCCVHRRPSLKPPFARRTAAQPA